MGRIDAAVKHAITAFPQDWARFLGVPPGVEVGLLDPDLSAVTSAADKVILVRDDPPFLLHVEPQGYYDESLDERMLTYAALLRRRHQMPVHSVAVALDRRAWGAANAGEVRWESPLGHSRLKFRYEVVRVWDLSAEGILSAGAGVLPLAAIADVPRDDVPRVVERIAEEFDRQVPRAEAAELWTATYILVGLKYDRAFAEILLRGVRDIMHESDTYLAIVEEGVEKGLAKGKRDTLILQGTKRLGAPDAHALAEINAVADVARLDEMLLRVLDASGWDEVLSDPQG